MTPDLSSDDNEPPKIKCQKYKSGKKRSHSPVEDEQSDIKRQRTGSRPEAVVERQDLTVSLTLPTLTPSMSNGEKHDYDCRCGLKGQASIDTSSIPEQDLQCGKCGKWSHLACQQGLNGNANRAHDFKLNVIVMLVKNYLESRH
jgi:hypothetical protein